MNKGKENSNPKSTARSARIEKWLGVLTGVEFRPRTHAEIATDAMNQVEHGVNAVLDIVGPPPGWQPDRRVVFRSQRHRRAQ